MEFGLVSVTVVCFAICAGSVGAQDDCRHALQNYFECQRQARDETDDELKHFQAFSNAIDACFERSVCSNPDLAASDRHADRTCIQQYKTAVSSAQSRCWSESFALPTSLLKPIRLLSEVTDLPVTVSEVLDAGNMSTYKTIAEAAQLSLEDLKANKCPPNELRQVESCINNNVKRLGTPLQRVTSLAQVENRYNRFCRQRRQCFDVMPARCRKALVTLEEKFCNCFADQVDNTITPQFLQCSALQVDSVVIPDKCDPTLPEVLCRQTFAEANESEAVEIPARKKRAASIGNFGHVF